jgi:polysaccharide pyruvyl transferase CsaB
LLAGFLEGSELEALIGEQIPKGELLRLDLRAYCALVVPGGSLLQDSSSLKSLLFYLAVIKRATASGVPVYLLHQGIGPLKSWPARWLTPLALRDTRLLALRDQDSFAWAQKQVLRPEGQCEVLYSADPVLGGRLKTDTALLPAVLQPRQYLVAAPRHSGDTDLAATALARFYERAAELSGLPVLLTAFQPDQDQGLCEAIVSKSSQGKLSLYQQAAQFPASAMIALLAHSAGVIGHRLHSLVLAAAYGVPAFGLAYDPKVSSFCEEMGYPCCYPAAVNEQSARDELSQFWHGREPLVTTLLQRRAAALQRLAAAEQRLYELVEACTGKH